MHFNTIKIHRHVEKKEYDSLHEIKSFKLAFYVVSSHGRTSTCLVLLHECNEILGILDTLQRYFRLRSLLRPDVRPERHLLFRIFIEK